MMMMIMGKIYQVENHHHYHPFSHKWIIHVSKISGFSSDVFENIDRIKKKKFSFPFYFYTLQPHNSFSLFSFFILSLFSSLLSSPLPRHQFFLFSSLFLFYFFLLLVFFFYFIFPFFFILIFFFFVFFFFPSAPFTHSLTLQPNLLLLLLLLLFYHSPFSFVDCGQFYSNRGEIFTPSGTNSCYGQPSIVKVKLLSIFENVGGWVVQCWM